MTCLAGFFGITKLRFDGGLCAITAAAFGLVAVVLGSFLYASGSCLLRAILCNSVLPS